MNPKDKITITFDYLFGKGIAKALPLDELEVASSKRTGRIRTISKDGQVIASFRSDGGIALTILGAQILSRQPAFAPNCVVVDRNVTEPIASGKSVFSKHVIQCGDRIRPGSEVVVLNEDGKAIAVGKAIISSKMIRSFRVGVAVKVREGISHLGPRHYHNVNVQSDCSSEMINTS
jgi:uncharacterized protein with predicted RNA binding PUA domain